jgi:hypothetical protein
VSDLRLGPSVETGLWLLFGLVTAVLLEALASGFGLVMSRLALLLLAASGSALLVAGLWILILGVRSGPAWALALGVGIWIPYVNFVLATIFARRYWDAGARTPALLALGGLFAQTLATLLLLRPPTPVLV